MDEKDRDICDIRKERDNLAMLVRRLAYNVQKGNGKSSIAIAEKAMRYLSRMGLEGLPVR